MIRGGGDLGRGGGDLGRGAAIWATAAVSSHAAFLGMLEEAAAHVCHSQARRVGRILQSILLAEGQLVSVEDVGAARPPHSGSWSIG